MSEIRVETVGAEAHSGSGRSATLPGGLRSLRPMDSGTGESAMRCEEARPLISAELDKELDGIGAAQLRTHLADCVLCATERDTLAATVRLLRALPETEPPPALRRRIGAALLDAERAAQRRQPG